VECYRMWKDQHEELVQPDLNDTRNKYSL
jgi:hypothetical protein